MPDIIQIKTDVVIIEVQQKLTDRNGKTYFKCVTMGKNTDTGEIVLSRVINVFPQSSMKGVFMKALLTGIPLLVEGKLSITKVAGGVTNDAISLNNPIRPTYGEDGKYSFILEGVNKEVIYEGVPGEDVIPEFSKVRTMMVHSLQNPGQKAPLEALTDRPHVNVKMATDTENNLPQEIANPIPVEA